MLDADKLDELKQEGKLTEQEYAAERKRLADKIINQTDGQKGRNGIIYILLAWFLGALGLHNFYAGYWGRGLVQLILTIIAPWFLYIPLILVAIWVFLELLFVNKGAHGIPFTGNRKIIMILKILAVVVLISAISYSNLVVYEVDMTTIEP